GSFLPLYDDGLSPVRRRVARAHPAGVRAVGRPAAGIRGLRSKRHGAVTHMDVDLTPRTIRFGLDRRNATTITPTEYSCSRLVAEIADGWLGYHESVGSQPATTANRSSILRKLGRHLSRPEDSQLTLHGPGEMLTQRLHDWEQHLIASSGPTSRVP